jgi:hypothetical protein
MMRPRHDGQTNEERIRDLRIMVRQGKSVAYISDVLGLSEAALRRTCAEYHIPLDDRTLTNDPAPCLRRKRAPPLRAPGRTSALTFSIEPELADKLVAEANRQNCSVSVIIYRIVAGTYARGLWADYVDPMIGESKSQFVASASHPNQNNETQ